MKRLFLFTMAFLAALSVICQEDDYRKREYRLVETTNKSNFISDFKCYDSIPPIVYAHGTQNPLYPGGYGEMDKFIRKNLNFPPMVWKQWQKFPINKETKEKVCRCVVRKDGKAIIVPNEGSNKDIELVNEIARVFSLMPLWEPARLKGKRIDAIIDIGIKFLDPFYLVPYKAAPTVRRMVKMAKSADRHYSYGVDKSMAENISTEILAVHENGWDHIEPSLAGAHLLAGLGKYNEAAELLESMLVTYHNIGFHSKPSLYTGSYLKTWSDGQYKGVRNLEAAVTLVAICCLSGDQDNIRIACDKAISLVDLLMQEGLGYQDRSMEYMREYNDLLQEKKDIVDHSRSSGISLNSDDRYNIEREKLLYYRNREIDKRIEEGKISNAQITQINNRLKNLDEPFASFSLVKKPKNTFRLLQIRTMLIGMRDGVEAEKAYIAGLTDINVTGKKISGLIADWSKNLTLPVCSRKELAECLALYAPLMSQERKTMPTVTPPKSSTTHARR